MTKLLQIDIYTHTYTRLLNVLTWHKHFNTIWQSHSGFMGPNVLSLCDDAVNKILSTCEQNYINSVRRHYVVSENA